MPLVNLKPDAWSRPILVACAISLLAGCGTDDVPPSVLQTVPANGDREVDPALSELSVTFSEQMRDGNWSWVHESKKSFPQMLGHPRFVDGMTRNLLPVRLEPNKEYVVWLNSEKFTNFRDEAGNSAPPFNLTFRTGAASK